MTRRLAVLLLAAAPFAAGPAPASACMGPVCDTICAVWTGDVSSAVVAGSCPID